MSGPKTYEVQTFSQGDWKIQAFFDDKDLALLEARRMVEARRYPALRVVEETWSDSEQVFKSRVVFRESEALRHTDRVTMQRAETRRKLQEERRRRQKEEQLRAQERARKRTAWRQSYVVIALKALGIAVLALVALNGLRALGS